MSNIPVFDGHNDSLVNVFLTERGQGRSFLEKSEVGQLDLVRALEGGLYGGFFAVYTPAPETSPERDPDFGLRLTETGYQVQMHSSLEPQYAFEFTSSVFDLAYQLEAESQGQMRIVRNFGDLTWCFANKVLGVVLHIEGAAAIDEELENLQYFFKRGLRSLGLVWSRPNIFGCGVPFRFPHSPDTGPGLTDRGKELVQSCNELGIVVDLSHINEKGFWDVASLSQDPLVVSHAGAYSLCPSTRNLTDDQITAVAESNGVVGVIFEPCNTRSDGAPNVESGLKEIVQHIEYLVGTVGVDHVAFGSDFDGAQMPQDLKNASEFQKLIAALYDTGFGEKEVEKISSKNWFRVLEDTWVT